MAREYKVHHHWIDWVEKNRGAAEASTLGIPPGGISLGTIIRVKEKGEEKSFRVISEDRREGEPISWTADSQGIRLVIFND